MRFRNWKPEAEQIDLSDLRDFFLSMLKFLNLSKIIKLLLYLIVVIFLLKKI
jgi:hypothetical protein